MEDPKHKEFLENFSHLRNAIENKYFERSNDLIDILEKDLEVFLKKFRDCPKLDPEFDPYVGLLEEANSEHQPIIDFDLPLDDDEATSIKEQEIGEENDTKETIFLDSFKKLKSAVANHDLDLGNALATRAAKDLESLLKRNIYHDLEPVEKGPINLDKDLGSLLNSIQEPDSEPAAPSTSNPASLETQDPTATRRSNRKRKQISFAIDDSDDEDEPYVKTDDDDSYVEEEEDKEEEEEQEDEDED